MQLKGSKTAAPRRAGSARADPAHAGGLRRPGLVG